MARRRYYRRPVRVVAAKKKWATNFKYGHVEQPITSAAAEGYQLLVANSLQTSLPTPVIIKTGNFKVQGDCAISISGSSGYGYSGMMITLYVMYLPEALVSQQAEGTNVMSRAVEDHPEWIMAWKVIDTNLLTSTNITSNSVGFSFSSRLKRNLNSGDSVALITIIKNAGSGTGSTAPNFTFRLNYAVQYWTCSN